MNSSPHTTATTVLTIEAVYTSLSQLLGVSPTMPPRRHAQGPPSSPPPLRNPLQTRPPYAPSELLLEGTKRRRLLSTRAKAAKNQELNKDTVPLAPSMIPGRATAKQQKEWSDYLQRKGDAARLRVLEMVDRYIYIPHSSHRNQTISF